MSNFDEFEDFEDFEESEDFESVGFPCLGRLLLGMLVVIVSAELLLTRVDNEFDADIFCVFANWLSIFE